MWIVSGYRGGSERAEERDYLVRSFRPPASLNAALDDLAMASGVHYTGSLVEFWRVVRRKGIWLDESELEKIIRGSEKWESGILHSQTRQATMHSFFDALATWKANRTEDPNARPPHKTKRFFKITWIQNGIRLKTTEDGLTLFLSRGKDGTKLRLPIEIPVPDYLTDFGVPSKVEIGWRKATAGGGYEVRCVYTRVLPGPISADGRPVKVAGCDLGEVCPFVITDGERGIIYNGGELRAKRRYRNKTRGSLDALISKTKPGSRRRKHLVVSKRRQLGTIGRQIRDIEHKLTRRAVTDLESAGVTDLVIGDLRRVRTSAPSPGKTTEDNPTMGRRFDQLLHQAPLGRDRDYLTYKSRRAGIRVPDLLDEAGTTGTCPTPGCGGKTKPSNRRWRCRRCGLVAHRDAVGAWNIRAKYLGVEPWGKTPTERFRVVGAVAAPTGVRYHPHMRAGPPESGVAVPSSAIG